MPQGISIQDALDLIEDLDTSGNLTVQGIKDIVAQVDASVPTGNTIIFYSNQIGDRPGFEVVRKIAENSSQISFSDNALVTELLNDRNSPFRAYLEQARISDNAANGTNFSFDQIMNGLNEDGTRNGNGMWDIASRSLAQNARGDIKTFTAFADANSIFTQTELPTLINNSAVDSIDGVPRSVLLDALNNGGLDDAYELIRVNSFSNAAQLRLTFDANGGINEAWTNRLYDGTSINDTTPPLSGTDTGATLFHASFSDEFVLALKASANKLTAVGVAVDLVATNLFAFYDAYQAYEDGDTALAFFILTTHFAELAEVAVGSALGLLFSSPLTAGLIAAGGWLAVAGITVAFVAAAVGGALVSTLFDFKAIAEDLGLIDTGVQEFVIEIDGQDYTIGVNDIYYNGEHILGEDEFFGFTDQTLNLIHGDENYVTLTGTDDEDVIVGNDADNVIEGGKSADALLGGSGNDTIIGSEGEGEIIDGGSGVDFVDFTQLGTLYDVDIHTNLSNGGTLLDYAGISSDNQTLHNIENVTTGGGNDRIVAAANDNITSNFRLSIAA